MKPARPPVATPQISVPRALTASRSLPAIAWTESRIAAMPAAAASENRRIVKLPLSLPRPVSVPVLRSCQRRDVASELRQTWPPRIAYSSGLGKEIDDERDRHP